ncbi:YMGG-like glycine zipper-containing protein [Methylohalobius crimeensis]|uniref:YMGG-like glycine zipper-containing protein n=1 Tax=Methylohalobius crimeensis TaxID=244365 RepID=UPI0003B6CFCF|nr:YMGG-like glycine zipper-containing protein [Methylohalobius crimeensis]
MYIKRMVAGAILAGFLVGLTACTNSPYSYQGATAAGAIGAAAGALIDQNNRWRGALIGGALGGTLGAITTEIAARAAREAAFSGRSVAYQSNDGWQRVEAQPLGYDARTRCHKVHEKIWQGGNLVEDHIREVCEGEKTEQRY